MSSLIISKPSNPKDTEELDLLLWEILWKGACSCFGRGHLYRGCERITTIARNTSANFFSKLGFNIIREKKPADHPDFLKHGITFEFMEKTLTKKAKVSRAAAEEE